MTDQNTENQQTQRPDGKTISQSQLFKNILKKAEKYLEHPTQVIKLLNEAFQKAARKKSLGAIASEVWESFQVLSHMLRAAINGEYKGIPNTTLVGGVAIILYFLMPIDLIPDFIPVVGLLDDAALLAWFMTSIKSELDRFKEWDDERQARKATVHTFEPHHADSSAGTPKFSDRSTGVSTATGEEATKHDSEGHGEAQEPGHHEPIVRASTTDSSRAPKNPHDDVPDGGNIR